MSLLKKLSDFQELVETEYKRITKNEEFRIEFLCTDYVYYREFNLPDFLEFKENENIDLGSINLNILITTENHPIFSCRVISWPGKRGQLIIDCFQSDSYMLEFIGKFTQLLTEMFYARYSIVTIIAGEKSEAILNKNLALISKVSDVESGLTSNIYHIIA